MTTDARLEEHADDLADVRSKHRQVSHLYSMLAGGCAILWVATAVQLLAHSPSRVGATQFVLRPASTVCSTLGMLRMPGRKREKRSALLLEFMQTMPEATRSLTQKQPRR